MYTSEPLRNRYGSLLTEGHQVHSRVDPVSSAEDNHLSGLCSCLLRQNGLCFLRMGAVQSHHGACARAEARVQGGAAGRKPTRHQEAEVRAGSRSSCMNLSGGQCNWQS